jgi:uncharacterized protein YecT (DUF1311 family)
MILIALAATLSAAAPADRAYDQCMDRATTNTAFAACGSALVTRADAALNRAWKAAYMPLDARTKATLLAEQRAWIAWKDKSCGYWQTGAFGREGQVIHFYTCRAAVIDARSAYLRDVGNTDNGVR